MAKEKAVQTPLMKQYYGIKDKYPDAILLFRVGDFYETFSDDAIKVSEILGITLTRRANGAAQYVELAGFPHHALDTYLPKLVRAGQRVAVCDQLEDPKMTKTIVKRGVTELVTPGVAINDNILEHRENNFLAAVHLDSKYGGIAFLDLSTGEFLTAEGTHEHVEKLLSGFKPKEVLYEKAKKAQFTEIFGSKNYVYPLEDWVFTADAADDRLLKHFETKSLKGFGVHNLKYGTIAAGAILHYLDLTQHHQISHITSLSRIEEERYVWLDKFTIRNLELFQPVNEGGKALIDIIDKTITPMGSRMLKRWVALPLKDVQPIKDRQAVVEYFFREPELRSNLENHLRPIGDLERLVSKVAAGRLTPREMVQLKNALGNVAPAKELCQQSENEVLQHIGEQLNPCRSLFERIHKEVSSDPPSQINKGGVIAEGVSEELDELRSIAYSGKDYLNNLQKRESELTGIPSLKIAFNNVFGYYIEVRNTHKDKVPENWIRKQTLVNAERYITEELKEYESKILGAEEKILALETQLYAQLVSAAGEFIPAIQVNATLLARLDCLIGFSVLAAENKYIRPDINDSDEIKISAGRHPVIEKQLPPGEAYIPNDVCLNNEKQQIIIITGPNMAGKSALLRQTALIVLMAQTGSFVPAETAQIGVVDKIFTRVGASDNISQGESTFMVEMNEAASILNNISDRSLVLFDELGRGTSTYDGISIAWSIVEYIHENKRALAKTLFATHYHELNEMANTYKRCKNYNVSVKEVDNKVIFLRKLVPGGSNHSFGIHVARMAGMPKSVVKRADDILKELEDTHRKGQLSKPVGELAKQREGFQLSFFQLDDPVLKQIRDRIASLDINNLTPMDALNQLNEIKKIAGL
ncbi:DNA mismatch repair protein MutS [Alkalitalea saponilacus]|uniref:DNA mismatch repair protein MutS n=1 Tax=Alkalitalea saponilacus TaxID=889453 RepID=A0A1T5BLT0_9BACT|nr:DNA mismatch repair protein MutS [Alkalitalea saponilacus]ASB49657.1 DNA mismatch repair protein MutS [Alkalitalea saponilacus]SKB48029.1 DNA mismatch repair protein MutS [Alkalitalea saponilacus]